MKLQIALDDIDLESALEVVKQIEDVVDIIEIGTPFMMLYGMKAVETFKTNFPQKLVLCDAKIMDAGKLESKLTFDYGADIVTVLGVTDDLTIIDVVKEAHANNKQVMVDMICVENLKERIETIEELGVDIIAVHTGVDQQASGRTPLDDLKEMKKYAKKSQVAVAGGLNQNNIKDYLEYNPDIVIVGGGILGSENPVLAAKTINKILKGE
ncbi:MAG: 3-hexulose-6-phosphate synthase [Erysipelotrichaceae bacterium]|nr:3-hexulose-6-phosphate synthase [Erysipelotrichaceae bacterium]